MWEYYAHRYRLIAKVVSVTQAQNSLPDLRRYRVVIIDESHNLRNREGRRWTVNHSKAGSPARINAPRPSGWSQPDAV
jgi:superfamily II DNA or RNA helicase